MTLQDRLSRIKLLAMDFDGVFTDNHVYTFADGSEAVRTSRADGLGLDRLRKLGVRLVVITGEPAFTGGRKSIADVRCTKLGLSVKHAEGGITKAGILNEIVTDYRDPLTYEQVAYIGNDVNDLDCLKAAGMGIVPHDSTLPALSWEVALPNTRGLFRTKANGGNGAVREVCDLIADAIEQGQQHPNWQRIAEAIG